MEGKITFQQLDEQWPLPNIVSLAELIDDRERSESLRSLLDAHGKTLSDVYDCARLLFDHGFLSFDLSWTQTEVDVEVELRLPKDVPTSSIHVQHAPDSVTVSLKPFRTPILDCRLWDRVDVDESQWTVERLASASVLKVELRKQPAVWWTQLFQDRDRPGPACQSTLSAERAYTYAQTVEMAISDPVKVFSMYKLAADSGHPIAASRVGNTYIDGDKAAGVEQDQRTALHYLMIGAENGNHECMFQVGHAFHHGIVFDRDFDKAVFWYTQAAESGRHLRATYYLGHIYHSFPDREPDPVKAVYWWQRAAEQDLPDSLFNLALYYATGAPGVEQNKAKAVELFKKATAANPSYIELMHQNKIDLEKLEAEVAEESQPPPPRPRRRRPKKRTTTSSWNASIVGVSVVGVGVVLALAWYNRDAIRLWADRHSAKDRLQSP